MLTPMEKARAAFQARAINADMLPPMPGGEMQDSVEYIFVHDWMPGPGDDGRGEFSISRQVVVWAPLDRAARWYIRKQPTQYDQSARYIGRYRQFVIFRDYAPQAQWTHSAPIRTVWAGNDARVIDQEIDAFALDVADAQSEAREAAARLSELGMAAGYADQPCQTPRSIRLSAIADALACTPDAAEARRIADEWDGTSKPEGRLKKLKRMAQKHGVWAEGLGL